MQLLSPTLLIASPDPVVKYTRDTIDHILERHHLCIWRRRSANSLVTSQMDSHYPPDLTRPQSEYLLSVIEDWSIAHGFAVRPPSSFIPSEVDPRGAVATTAPVTLFPSTFPRACFEQGRRIQEAYNELYAAIARDEQWLGSILGEYVPMSSASWLFVSSQVWF